jgi:Bifunctional DNA primase/polymerase, N-terminal
VDCDWPEARWLAARFLRPDTLRGAKGTEDPSQYFYRVAGLPYAKFTGLERGKGAEILSVKASDEDKGHQVCVAPSIHEVKGPYVWVDGYDASRIVEQVRGVLQHQVSLLATASLIARELPASREEGGGGRHAFAMALSGYLLRGGSPRMT